MTKIEDVMKDVLMRHDTLRVLRDIRAREVQRAERQRESNNDLRSMGAFLRGIGKASEKGLPPGCVYSLGVQDELLAIFEEFDKQHEAMLAKLQAIIDRESEALKNVDVER